LRFHRPNVFVVVVLGLRSYSTCSRFHRLDSLCFVCVTFLVLIFFINRLDAGVFSAVVFFQKVSSLPSDDKPIASNAIPPSPPTDDKPSAAINY
jgi:uncharacterized membrane protein